MYILNIFSTIKKMLVDELRDFIFENYYKRIGFAKESSSYPKKQKKKDATKLTANILILVILKNNTILI